MTIIVGTIASVTTIVVLAGKYHNLSVNYDKVVKENAKLIADNKLKDNKIKQLSDLCIKKDAVAMNVFAKGTKRGDPDCARQLAYRRWYLERAKKATLQQIV